MFLNSLAMFYNSDYQEITRRHGQPLSRLHLVCFQVDVACFGRRIQQVIAARAFQVVCKLFARVVCKLWWTLPSVVVQHFLHERGLWMGIEWLSPVAVLLELLLYLSLAYENRWCHFWYCFLKSCSAWWYDPATAPPPRRLGPNAGIPPETVVIYRIVAFLPNWGRARLPNFRWIFKVARSCQRPIHGLSDNLPLSVCIPSFVSFCWRTSSRYIWSSDWFVNNVCPHWKFFVKRAGTSPSWSLRHRSRRYMRRYQKLILTCLSRKSYGRHGMLGGETIPSQQVYPNQKHSDRADTIGIMSFVMHEFVYFGRSLPWVIVDSIPYFHRFKIQDVPPF